MDTKATAHKNVCRICLGPASGKCRFISEKYNNYFIYEHVNSIAHIDIKDGDGYPNKICAACLLDLETAVNFKQKCENSNVILHTTVDLLPMSVVKVEYNLSAVVKKEEPEYKDDFDYTDSTELLEQDKHSDINVKQESIHRKDRDCQLQCDDCGNFFKSKCKLRVHWKREHFLKSLICINCKRTFKSFKAFKRHKEKLTQSCRVLASKNVRIEGEGRLRVFHCKECQYRTMRAIDMKSHLVTHSGERPYACMLCPKAFTQLCALQDHEETVHKNYRKGITCQYCGIHIKGRRKAYRHLEHHQSKKVQCDICKKMCRNKKVLKVHLLRHTGVKSFTCEMCAYGFYSYSELCNHRRNIHEKGLHWYNCDKCEFKTMRSYIMKRHKNRHTGVNVPCTVCGSFFLTANQLMVHQRRHFADKNHSCPHCDAKFLRRDSLNKHLKMKHSKPVNVKEENQTVCNNFEGVIEIELSPMAGE